MRIQGLQRHWPARVTTRKPLNFLWCPMMLDTWLKRWGAGWDCYGNQ